jgi:hypothetical protein
MSHQHLLGKAQRKHDLLAGHAREIVQEIRQRVAGLDVVQQCSERNAGAGEHWRATQDIRVRLDQWCRRGHDVFLPGDYTKGLLHLKRLRGERNRSARAIAVCR